MAQTASKLQVAPFFNEAMQVQLISAFLLLPTVASLVENVMRLPVRNAVLHQAIGRRQRRPANHRRHASLGLHAQKQTFNPKRHSDELRAWLKENGALDAKWPTNIRAERFVDGPRPTEENKKIVHFQRHGQGYHNLIYAMMAEHGSPVEDIYSTDPKLNPFVRDELCDAPLTSLGRDQCLEKRQLANSLNPELIVVSPLHRAVQTAQLTFADFIGDVRFVAHDLCREELGLLYCNKRRPLSESLREFPHVDFSLTSGEEDTLWQPDERESPLAKSKRIYSFLADYIQHRPEKEIAVVGHSAYFFNMCNAVLDCGDDDDIQKWFGTSEIRSLVLTFDDAVE